MHQSDREDELLQIADLPLTTENLAYSACELVPCPKCSRANAPNRFNCVYCGSELSVDARQVESAKLTLRPAEDWQPGFNLILVSAENPDAGRAASVLNVSRELMEDFLSAGHPLPLARLASSAEAAAVAERLNECGLAVSVIPDEELDADHPPRRLRGLEFIADGTLLLRPFSGEQPVGIPAEEVALIVTGTFRRSELASTSKRTKGTFKTVDETVTSSDTDVIDIYTLGDARGYRITSMGFDFSCLRTEMTPIAASNVQRLTEKLRFACFAARFVDSYDRLTWLLDAAWPVGSKRESGGVQRGPVGGVGMSTVETSDNTKQLTRFSRLCARRI